MTNGIKLFSVLCVAFFVNVANADEHSLDEVLENKAAQKGLEDIAAMCDNAANMLIKIGGLISPSGQEHERAEATPY